jgi:hypothetical protein
MEFSLVYMETLVIYNTGVTIYSVALPPIHTVYTTRIESSWSAAHTSPQSASNG